MALLFDHINLAYIQPNTADAGTRNWIAQTAKRVTLYDWRFDFSAAIANGCKFFTYVSGNSFYRLKSPGYTQRALLDTFLASRPDLSHEKLFFHYAENKVHATGTRAVTQLVAGPFAPGLIPGFGSGDASAIGQSRIISTQWPAVQSNGPIAAHNVAPNHAYPFRNSYSSLVRSGGVVTATTIGYNGGTAEHGLAVGDPIENSGIPLGGGGLDFDGYFVVASVPSPTSITYIDVRGADSSSGGLMTCWYWISFSLNVVNDEWVEFYAWDMNRMQIDAAGNKLHGLFFDSMLGTFIFGLALELSKCKELQEDDPVQFPHPDYPHITDPALAPNIWVGEKYGIFYQAMKAKYVAWRGDNQAMICGNGDGFSYALRLGMYDWHRKYSEIILLEGGMTPRLSVGNLAYEDYWKNAWTLMETDGVEIIYQGYSGGSFADLVHWTHYSGNIYYTDAFAWSKTQITLFGGWSVSRNSIAEVTTPTAFFHDMATGRYYIYATSQPPDTNTNSGTFVGYEKYRFMPLCMYYVFGKHAKGFYYQHDASQSMYTQNLPSVKTWFGGMEYDIGQPAVGGKKSDGNFGVDLSGVSTEISNRGFRFWTKPGPANKHVYARKYDNAYALYRMCDAASSECGTDPQPIPLPFTARRLRGDGTLDAEELTEITIAYGEGVILVTETEAPPLPSADNKILIGIFK